MNGTIRVGLAPVDGETTRARWSASAVLTVDRLTPGAPKPTEYEEGPATAHGYEPLDAVFGVVDDLCRRAEIHPATLASISVELDPVSLYERHGLRRP